MSYKEKKFWNGFFEWTKSEKRMAYVLVVLIIISFGLSIYFKNMDNTSNIHISYLDSIELDKSVRKERFQFNPNTCTKDDFIKLGFKPYIADRIIKFRAKYGIYSENTFKKIYGIDTSFVSQLSDWMYFDKKLYENNSTKTNQNYRKPLDTNLSSKYHKSIPKLEIELNSADTTQIKFLKGIGTKRALTIVNYREKLGGFISEKQLYEVWGLDSSIIDSIILNIWIDTSLIRKIKINNINAEEFAKHPYVSKKTATLLINYRKQHGVFEKKEDLYKQIGVNKLEIEKIFPYLDFTD